MQVRQVLGVLDEAVNALLAGVAIQDWRVPPTTPEDPVHAVIDPAWPIWSGDQFNGNNFYPSPSNPGPLRKYEKNYLYADLTMPATHAGIDLAGSEAMLLINGWMPFTLWLDGQELYRETHAWHATGPLADPFPVKIEPGKTHRLVLCLEPTDMPTGYSGLFMDLKFGKAIDVMTPVGVAAQALHIADKLVTDGAGRRKLDALAAMIDVDAIARQDWPAVLASIDRMTKAAGWLSKLIKPLIVNLVGHTHIDMDWMWTWPDTVHCIRRDFHSVLAMMDDIPELCFTHSQVPTYKVIQERDPDLFARVKERIAEGRWEVAAGTWVEGDLNMADGEDLARHMLYAGDWCEANLGKRAEIFWAPDTFGHPGNMPQLATLGGMKHYFHWRGQRPGQWQPVRSWQGVDGTTVLAASQSYGAWALPHMLWHKALASWERGWKHGLFIWGLGDHGGGLPRWCYRQLERVMDHPLMPTVRHATMKRFITDAAGEMKHFPVLPASRGETQTLFPGCLTTHASIKSYNRRCETALLTAETLGALTGIDSRAVLREAWQGMLFNHFHDIMDGAAVHDTYINAHERAEAALAAAGEVTRRAMDVLVPARGGKRDGTKLTLVNALSFARTEPVCVDLPAGTIGVVDEKGLFTPAQAMDNRYVFVARDVPAWGTKTYTVVSKTPKSVASDVVHVTEHEHVFNQTFVIDTRTATVQVSKNNGTIASFIVKPSAADLVPYGVPRDLEHVYISRQDLAMNLFQFIDERPNQMSAWLINSTSRETNLVAGAKVSVVETGPVFARLRVEHSVRQSSIRQDMVIYNELARVDLDMTIDWRERGNPDVGVPQLKLAFNGSVPGPRARFDGPFVVTERPCDGIEQPTQKFVDVRGEGVGYTVFNDSRYGVDVLGGRCRVTLVRNPYGPDGEPDNGVHRVRMSVVPHDGSVSNEQLVQAGMAFNRPMLSAAGKPAAPALAVKLDAEGVVMHSLRLAEHGDGWLVRLVETNGRRASGTFTVGGGITQAVEVNFRETPLKKPVKPTRGRVALTWRPFEVKTLLLRR